MSYSVLLLYEAPLFCTCTHVFSVYSHVFFSAAGIIISLIHVPVSQTQILDIKLLLSASFPAGVFGSEYICFSVGRTKLLF